MPKYSEIEHTILLVLMIFVFSPLMGWGAAQFVIFLIEATR